ncbi:MAG: asparagine synthase (glutamine-hydrolyzing) [Planctomycetota bacterium]
MCGIVGIRSLSTDPHLPTTLAAMMTPIAHRGPDGEGIFIDPRGRCALGHKRLAIIDPTGGHQPMTNEAASLHIVFNGCIYNYKELHTQLAQAGHRFTTHTDTEVILHAYEEWGDDCVSRFNGMWSFAIYNSKTQTLFCSRDRLGVKPFYYAQTPDAFYFASEIKSLLATGCIKRQPNPDGLRQYLTFQYCLGDTTLFAGVQRLPPGHNLTITADGRVTTKQFWDLRFDIDEVHDEPWFIERMSDLLSDAVRLRLRSDVPLGAHLSGGLDSSIVVGLARKHLGDSPLKTFTGAFRDGPAFDETRYAKLVSQSARTEYLETYLGPTDFADTIQKIIWHMDEPAAGPGVFPQFLVAKLASKHVKVILGGQGGDELFIGYARYLVAYLEECIKGAIEKTAHRGSYVATLETIVPSLPSLESYIPMLKSFWSRGLFEEPSRRYFALMDRFADHQAMLSPDMKIDPTRTYDEFRAEFDGHGASAMINRILRYDLKTHLQSLLHVEDRTSMAWGLESRVPLLDYRLVELMASIPPIIKFRNGMLKHLLRKAVQDVVPADILNRTDKMGFPVPLSQWIAGDLRNFVGDILLSKRSKQRGLFRPDALEAAMNSSSAYSRAIWGALCLEIWHQQFIDA